MPGMSRTESGKKGGNTMIRPLMGESFFLKKEKKMENNQEQIQEIRKAYDHSEVEDRIYQRWMKKGYFHAKPDPSKKPYSIVMPPPNITGQLHMGHGLDNTLQDSIVRFRRMQGYETLWMPGTDHASIATEVKIVEQMKKEEGLTKEDIGREEFLKRAWKWKEEYGGRIVAQLKKLGSSCDWERERFTMDEGCNRAVKHMFVSLYNKGLIYKGNRIINWCPKCKTTLSDVEVNYEDQPSHLWNIRYDLEDGTGAVVVATTRPETMLGDTGVAVNPEDERYKDMVGKNCILPIMNRVIPIVADDYVEMDFGTGAVKMTPAHDPNDFEVAQRHNLEIIRVLDDEGRVNENGGKYCGMDRDVAREKIVEELREMGNLVSIEDYSHNVGKCYRCGTIIEPIISAQWFVSMKSLSKPAIEAVRDGRIRFVPDRYAKTYFNWMENIRDWCISRQLWWGHRIPVYYCKDCGKMVVSENDVFKCPDCGGEMYQDEDVLDTWFSSGLWPFSTMGWPEQTEELKYFYPTDVLVTGYDIIFFWVARMIVFGMEAMGEIPFKYVNIHGIVRDDQGRKMSKSLGNGIDPLKVIEEYGADSLRFSLAQGTSPGNDMRFYDSKVKAAGNFANKIWNASRFVAMNIKDNAISEDIEKLDLDISDKWILSRLNTVISEVTDNLERFELGLACSKIYDFIWSEYCDWYIEMTKPRLYEGTEDEKATALSVLVYVLKQALKMLHPIMPFITEEIYVEMLHAGESIMISKWPEPVEGFSFGKEESAMEEVMNIVRSIRNIRSQMNVPPSRKAKIYIATRDRENLEAAGDYIAKLAYGSEVEFHDSDFREPEGCAAAITTNSSSYIPLGELIDISKEIERLSKELASLKGEVERANGKLQNERFVSKAPEKVVQEERDKLAKYTDMLKATEERLHYMEGLI